MHVFSRVFVAPSSLTENHSQTTTHIGHTFISILPTSPASHQCNACVAQNVHSLIILIIDSICCLDLLPHCSPTLPLRLSAGVAVPSSLLVVHPGPPQYHIALMRNICRAGFPGGCISIMLRTAIPRQNQSCPKG